MTEFGASQSNNKFPNNAASLQDLTTQHSKDAVAFVRSGLGEEVVPGFFILNKDLALAVAALRIHPDAEFLAKEAQLAHIATSEGQVSANAVVQESAALLERLDAKIDTKRGIFYVGTQPTVRTNLFELALPELPQFKKAAEHINGAINYITRTRSVYVIEGAQWAKADLLLLLLTQYSLSNPREGFALVSMYETFRSTLEAAPDVLEPLQQQGILPTFTTKTNAFTFWGELFSTSKCANNPGLISWIRSTMAWPEMFEKIDIDGVFIGVFLAHACFAGGKPDLAATILERFQPVLETCTAAAKVVDLMSKASLARVARSN
jgi:hypothetical protein